MKIALVSPYDYAHPGGVGRHIASLDTRFVKLGHDVRVIAPASRPITEFGDRFIRIGRPFPVPASDSYTRVPLSLHLAPAIKKVMAEEKFDIVHLHEPFMPMLCSAVLRFSNTVNVGTFHAASGSPGYNFGKPISSWMLHRRSKKLHGHIAVSNPALRYAMSYVPAEYDVIPNGVDTHIFHPGVEPMEQFMDGKLNIVFLSRLEPRKGLNYLLKAFLEVKKQMPNTRLIVCGEGTTLRTRYENWIKDNQLKDVVFTGLVPEKEKQRYFRTADIYCAPNTGHESFGLILVEAMATGRPVVASHIEGFAAVVTHGQEGLLVPPMDSRSLAEALITLLDDKNKRDEMGKNARLTAQKYDWDGIADKVLAYYQTTIEKVHRQRESGILQ